MLRNTHDIRSNLGDLVCKRVQQLGAERHEGVDVWQQLVQGYSLREACERL